jgi:predicted O-methyltransferase YrrM
VTYDDAAAAWGPLTPYAMTPECWDDVRRLLPAGREPRTAETGSGVSTLLFAAAGCRHVALEHDPGYRDETVARLGRRPNVRVVLAPLVGRPARYDVPGGAVSGPLDLLLIDGPPAQLGGRFGVAQWAASVAGPNTAIVFDDVHRARDRSAAEGLAVALGRTVRTVRAGARAHALILP